MKFWSESFKDKASIPEAYAFGAFDAEKHVRLCPNKNPHFAWSEIPEGTKSFVLICCDIDVPSSPENVNQEGKTVSYELKRAPFYHWALTDFKGSSIEEGSFSQGITPKGKPGPEGAHNTRSGLNNYTQWFEGDADMQGEYFGYDGPCPPWNDERVHRYEFTLYAMDWDRAPLEGKFTAPDLLEKMKHHLLAQTTITGTYSIYPKAKL